LDLHVRYLLKEKTDCQTNGKGIDDSSVSSPFNQMLYRQACRKQNENNDTRDDQQKQSCVVRK